jgi:hypothetical protein
MTRLTKNGSFNHDAEDMFSAVGYTQQEIMTVREKILYHTMKMYVDQLDQIKLELSDGGAQMVHAESPKVSMILNNLCNSMTTDDENNLCLLMFTKLHGLTQAMFAQYALMNIEQAPQHLKKLVEIKIDLEDSKFMSENGEDVFHKAMSPKKIIKRFDLVKLSPTIDDYLKLYGKENFEPMHTDIDSMLEKVFDFS